MKTYGARKRAAGRARRPIVALIGVFIGLSAVGGVTGTALGAVGAASSAARPDAGHHPGARLGHHMEP